MAEGFQPCPQSNLKNSTGNASFRENFLLDLIRQLQNNQN